MAPEDTGDRVSRNPFLLHPQPHVCEMRPFKGDGRTDSHDYNPKRSQAATSWDARRRKVWFRIFENLVD